MKKTNFIHIALFALVAILFASCSNILDDERQELTPTTISSEKAKLLLNIGNANSRTIFASDVELSEMTYTLSGSLSNASKTTIKIDLQYSQEGLKKSNNDEILVDTGNWEFILTAYKNNKAIYQATANQEIKTGENSISFTLSEIENVSGGGELSITLNNLPVNSGVSKVKVDLLTLDEKLMDFATMTINLSDEQNSLIYEKTGIENGIYIVRFKFYRADGTEITPGYNELVQIKAERKSSAERTLSDIEKYHSLTLNGLATDGITIHNPIQKSFNECEVITLPTKDDIFRIGYEFEGWYASEDCIGEAVTQIPSGTTEDKTYWAKWQKNTLEDFYLVIDGKKLENGETIEIKNLYTQIEVVTIPANLTDDEKAMTWSSSPNLIGIFVNGRGLITIQFSNKDANGTMTITATSKNNNTLKKTLIVNVSVKTFTQSIFRQYCEDHKDELNLAKGWKEGSIYQYVTEFTIPEGYDFIGDSAFGNCSSLESVTIPDSVTSISSGAFRGCDSLKDVYYKGDIVGWCKITFSGDNPNPMFYAKNFYLGEGATSPITELVIPSGITQIDCRFYNFSTVKSVIIPDSVTSIGSSAFFGCSSLTSVIIPDSVTSIGSYAFSGCSSLTSVTIPNSVTSIGYRAFYECSSLASVEIPNSVTSIDYYAFQNCSSLTSATFNNPNGWWYSTSSSATSGTSMSESDLSNPSTAATYLTSTYYNYYWKRN